MLSNLAMWNLIAGFLLPPVLAVIEQAHWPRHIRAGVAFLAFCLVALVTAWLVGNLSFENWVTSALTVLVAAISAYHGFWKPTGIAPTIEAKTNTGGAA